MNNITISDTTPKQDKVIDEARAQYNEENPHAQKTPKQFLVMELDAFVAGYVAQKRRQQREALQLDGVTDAAFAQIKAIAEANQAP
jgi:hypothetical protein